MPRIHRREFHNGICGDQRGRCEALRQAIKRSVVDRSGLLALTFLFAGGIKLVVPIAAMAKQVALPGSFLRFIGVAEVLGGLGMILPGITRNPDRPDASGCLRTGHHHDRRNVDLGERRHGPFGTDSFCGWTPLGIRRLRPIEAAPLR